MNTWILLTIAAICARAVYGLATKLLSSHIPVSPITQTAFFCASDLVLTLLVLPLLGGISLTSLGSMWLPAIVMVAAETIGNLLYFQGQKHLDVGTTQIAFSSILIWGTLLSLSTLGSHFSLLQCSGIVLLLAAILLAQYRKGTRRLGPGVLYIIASAMAFAGFQVSSAVLATKLSTGTYLVIAYAGPVLILSLAYPKKIWGEIQALRNQSFKKTGGVTLFTSGVAIAYATASYLAYHAAPDRGVVVVLLTTQVVLAVILSAIFLRERANLGRKLVAGALTVAAAVLIKA